MENTNNIQEDFITLYSEGILEEMGIEVGEDEKYIKLLGMVSDRVVARLYLELLASLTPEQVSEVAVDMNSDSPDPEKAILAIKSKISDFNVRVAQILSRVKDELTKDLAPLIQK